MLSTSPNKVVTFSVDRAIDLNSNSAPYLQYTYARAKSVLEKWGRGIDWDSIDYDSFSKSRFRRKLLILTSKFPYVVKYVANYLRPEDLAMYLNEVADTFNSWYDTEPIINEPDEGVRNAKLFLTYVVKVVIGNGLKLLGLDVLPRI